MSLIVSAVIFGALAQEPKTFQDKELGLTFQHPASWTVKKGKFSTDLSFSMSDGSITSVQVFNIQFRQEKSVWQQLQRDVSEQMRRRVSRQWEEQILGVPLLLTRVDYSDGDREVSALVGLLYTATKQKLNFRVTSTSGTVQDSETAWRQALMTLRTVNGEMPVPEDPTKPLPNPDKTSGGQSITRLTPDDMNGGPVRTKNVHRIARLGLQLNVFLPDGWSVQAPEETISLTIEKLQGSVELSITSGARQQVAGVLANANSSSFERFKLVSLRDDPVPGVKRSGSYVASTLRIGPGAKDGVAVAWHFAGTSGSVVWRIDYFASSEAAYKADKKVIDRLIDLAAVEIAP